MKRDFNLEHSITLDHLKRSGPLTDPQLGSVDSGLGRMAQTMNLFAADVDRISKSPKFTKEGAADEIRKRAEKAHDELNGTLQPVLTAVADQVNAAKNSMVSQPANPTDALLTFLRQREIRDTLAKMDAEVVTTKFFQAAENGDRQLFDAVIGAPSIKPLVTADARKTGVELRLAHENPEAAKLVSQLGLMKQVHQNFFSAAMKELEATAGHLGPDVIAQAAAGNASLKTV